jgi:hypothetical protein
MPLWQQILLSALGILVLLYIFPGIKPMLEKSKDAPKDWAGFLWPIAFVIAFVIFLVMTL